MQSVTWLGGLISKVVAVGSTRQYFQIHYLCEQLVAWCPYDSHGSILKSTICVNNNYVFKSRVDLRLIGLKIIVIKEFLNI